MKSIYNDGGKLTGNRKKLDKNNDGKISGEDFKIARDERKSKRQSKRALRKAVRGARRDKRKRELNRDPNHRDFVFLSSGIWGQRLDSCIVFFFFFSVDPSVPSASSVAFRYLSPKP